MFGLVFSISRPSSVNNRVTASCFCSTVFGNIVVFSFDIVGLLGIEPSLPAPKAGVPPSYASPLKIIKIQPPACRQTDRLHFRLSPREESNLDPRLRRPLFYPLNYREILFL